MHKRIQRVGLGCVAALLLAACIPIPYKPSATLIPGATPPAAPELLIKCAEDSQTQALAREIRQRDREIRTIPHRDVVTVAFPECDTTLERLLAAETRTALQQRGITYLVLIGQLSEREIGRLGGFVPLLGLGTIKEETAVTAGVIDLTRGESISGMSATSQGRTTGAIYGFFGLFATPMMNTSVYEAIAQGAVQTIRSRSPEGDVSIIVANVQEYAPGDGALPEASAPDGPTEPDVPAETTAPRGEPEN